MTTLEGNKPFEQNFDFNSLPDEKQCEKVFLHAWFKKDGDWVEEGQPLYQIRVGEHLGGYMCYTSQLLTAKKSGVVQQHKKKNDSIFDGDKVYSIHAKGTYLTENLPSNDSYFFYFDKFMYNIPEKYFKHLLEIKEWHKQDGEFINQGELILTFGYQTSYGNKDLLLHYAEKSGFFDKVRTQLDFIGLEQNELLYIIHDKDEDRIKRKFINVPDIILDEYTKKKIIKWSHVGDIDWYGKGINSLSLDRNTTLTFSFNNEDEKDFIVFHFFSKQLMLSKDDIVSFLFEDNRIVDFILNSNSYKIPSSDSEKLFENKILISDDELKHFEEHDLLKWKIIIKKQNREIIGGGEGVHVYKSKPNLTAAIRKFAKEYRMLVRSEIENYVPLFQRDTLASITENYAAEECFVYLMIDTNNNFHKIGISNKPAWREKTLQSEKPTIELIASKKFIRRKIASSFEKALHETYSHKRIRGEWFQLDATDVNEIKITLTR